MSSFETSKLYTVKLIEGSGASFSKLLLVNSNTEILHRYFESCLNLKIKVPFVKVFFAVIQSIRAVVLLLVQSRNL